MKNFLFAFATAAFFPVALTAQFGAVSGDLPASELHQSLARHKVVHHAVVQRLFGGQRFAAQDYVQRARQPDEARQAGAAAPRRHNAQLRFRESNLRGPLGRGDAGIARQANFIATPNTRPVNRGHRRNRQGGQQIKDDLAPFSQTGQVTRRGTRQGV